MLRPARPEPHHMLGRFPLTQSFGLAYTAGRRTARPLRVVISVRG